MGAAMARNSEKAVHQLQVSSKGELDLIKLVKVKVMVMVLS